MPLKRLRIALAVAGQTFAASVSAEDRAPNEAFFTCGRDWMTVRHEGTVSEDFKLGEIVSE